jgi:hypothetical protein
MSERACSAFMDMTVLPVAPETILYGRLTDAQLHGLLALCQDLGLQVVAIREAPSAAIAASAQLGSHNEQQHDRCHRAVADRNSPRRD